MKNVMVLAMMAALLLMGGCTQNVDMEAEKAKINTVLDQVIKALETKDMDLFSSLYAHDADMVSFGTDASERVVGWEALKALMKKQFAATDESKLSARDRTIKVNSSGKVAWFSEIIDWDIVSQGHEVKLEGLRGTGVLEKRNGKWVVVQVHYSIPAGS